MRTPAMSIDRRVCGGSQSRPAPRRGRPGNWSDVTWLAVTSAWSPGGPRRRRAAGRRRACRTSRAAYPRGRIGRNRPRRPVDSGRLRGEAAAATVSISGVKAREHEPPSCSDEHVQVNGEPGRFRRGVARGRFAEPATARLRRRRDRRHPPAPEVESRGATETLIALADLGLRSYVSEPDRGARAG